MVSVVRGVVCFLSVLEVGVGGAKLTVGSHTLSTGYMIVMQEPKVLLTTYLVCTGLWDAAQLDMDVLASPTSKLSA